MTMKRQFYRETDSWREY